MAAERFLLTRRSVSGKKLLNTAHIYTARIQSYNLHNHNKPKTLTGDSLWQSIAL